jgi:hypothetical protein
MTKLLEGHELEQRARKLGIDVSGELITKSSSGRSRLAPDYELQRRVTEAERSIRESRLWIIALISAIASAVSAIAAWMAVLRR